jgi:hypothetical protein
MLLGPLSFTGVPLHVRGYIRVSSSQPLHVWASKIEN